MAARKFSAHDWNGFTAQEFPVEIVPKFAMPAIPGISAAYGPFVPNYPIEVPLWLALYLRGTNTCTLTTPDFLRVDFLSTVLERDRDASNEYHPLPHHFFEIALQIVSVAGDNIPEVTEVIRLVGEIRATRRLKLLQSVCTLGSESITLPALKLTNLCAFEIDFLRTTLAATIDEAEALERRTAAMPSATLVRTTAALGSQTPAQSDTGSGAHRPSSSLGMGDTTVTATTGRPSTGAPPSDDGVDPALRLSFDPSLPGAPSTVVTATTATTAAPQPKKRRTLRQQ